MEWCRLLEPGRSLIAAFWTSLRWEWLLVSVRKEGAAVVIWCQVVSVWSDREGTRIVLLDVTWWHHLLMWSLWPLLILWSNGLTSVFCLYHVCVIHILSLISSSSHRQFVAEKRSNVLTQPRTEAASQQMGMIFHFISHFQVFYEKKMCSTRVPPPQTQLL